MKQAVNRLKNFFFPPPSSTTWRRIMPYAALGLLTLIVFGLSGAAWEYTNSSTFCGTACHTMPPEYTSYLTSPHARVGCVECHLGRGFIATNFTRKAGDAKHVISLAFKNYEFPITAGDLRPARETCEKCHFPEKFSDDSLREIKHFKSDKDNTPVSTYLILKTGGGTERLGMGRGIHWHIENQVYYFAVDDHNQEIPFVRVIDAEGQSIDYLDIDSDLDPYSINDEDLEEMDCITCHNRITHLVYRPEELVDRLIDRGLISRTIPEIRLKALEMLNRDYESSELALNAIAGIEGYYKSVYPEFLSANQNLIDTAIEALQNAYSDSVFPEQKSDWDSHPNNIGHQDTPGCFRCHDGKHLDNEDQAIRLECNLCHSIPVVVGPGDFVAEIEISRGPEPESHVNPNWIGLHRDVFDPSCSSCHTTEDPGGTSNSSFCSNTACHGSVYSFAGFDAPGLREILAEQLPPPPPPPPVIELENGAQTFDSLIGAMLQERCGSCHGANGLQGLDFTSYESAMAGGANGPVITSGDPDNSLLIQTLSNDAPHFAQFSSEELEIIIDWINNDSPEN